VGNTEAAHACCVGNTVVDAGEGQHCLFCFSPGQGLFLFGVAICWCIVQSQSGDPCHDTTPLDCASPSRECLVNCL
jgi:hypothetical protein